MSLGGLLLSEGKGRSGGRENFRGDWILKSKTDKNQIHPWTQLLLKLRTPLFFGGFSPVGWFILERLESHGVGCSWSDIKFVCDFWFTRNLLNVLMLTSWALLVTQQSVNKFCVLCSLHAVERTREPRETAFYSRSQFAAERNYSHIRQNLQPWTRCRRSRRWHLNCWQHVLPLINTVVS